MVSAAVRRASSDDPDALARDVYEQAAKAGLRIGLQELLDALDPEHFVAVRGVTGGPAASALNPELERAEAQLDTDRGWLGAERTHLTAKAEALVADAQALAGTIALAVAYDGGNAQPA